MTTDDPDHGGGLPVPTNSALVERSNVPAGLEYTEYRQYLRYDFFHSCAYCTMTECEAMAIRFVIDHYEPRKAAPDLVNEYSNLMYSCDECNTRKGNRCPPPAARANGYRFFRPDTDIRSDHFELTGVRLESKSNVSEYSIQALDLNRLNLRRIRDLRKRLTNCHQHVQDGVRGLRKFHIDQLPQNIKGAAARAIRDATSIAGKKAEGIDELLRDFAKSELIDPDPEAKSRSEARSAYQRDLEALYPGQWRAVSKTEK